MLCLQNIFNVYDRFCYFHFISQGQVKYRKGVRNGDILLLMKAAVPAKENGFFV